MNRKIRLIVSLCTAALIATGCKTTTTGVKASPSQAQASQVKPSKTKSGQAKDGKAKPRRAEPARSKGSTYLAKCGGQVRDLEAVLSPIVSKMVAQKIPYAQAPANEWRDCSGNFLRLTSYLAAACPEQQANLVAPAGIRDYRPGRNNVAPNGGQVEARTTRALAKWYYEQGNFTPVFYDGATKATDVPASLKAIRNRVRPGAVLWFSRGAPKSAGGVKALFNRNRAGTHINHMATVTKVERDAKGDVVRFEMYHGRSKGKRATVTTNHYWDWPESLTKGGKAYPAFGYWSQRVVGIATVVPTTGG